MLFALEHAGRGGERGPHFIFPLLFLLLLGLLVSKVIRRRGGGKNWHTHGSPMQTLNDRFARGEIDREEFEHRKAVLEGADVIPPAPPRAGPTSAPSAPPATEAPEPTDTLVADVDEVDVVDGDDVEAGDEDGKV